MSRKIISGVGVVIATTGRRSVVAATIESILSRESLPESIVIAGAQQSDMPTLDSLKSKVNIISSLSPKKGLTIQRNYGVTQLPENVDYISFLDDDVELHDRYFLEVKNVLEHSPNLVAFSGMVIANGDIESEQARKLLGKHVIPEGMPLYGCFRNKWPGLYGCSMNIRKEAITKEKFDENLPLYSLGEDIEIGFRLRKYGDIGGSARCPLVHLATKTGRIAEVGVGYAQIINYLYFTNKGIGYPRLSCYFERIIRVPFANLLFSLFPQFDKHSLVDRKGRLCGNLLAFKDLLKGNAHPSRLTDVVEATK